MKIRLLLLFVLSSILIIGLTFFYIEYDKNRHLEKVTKDYVKAYNTVYNDEKDLSYVILKNFLDLGNIQNRLYNFDKLPKNMQDYIREVTYKELQERYNNYKFLGIRQVHIHLPDNTSFLRMHLPQKFGDNLTGIRPTVEYVNKNKKEIDSFEEGRVQYGLRFVYPIFRDDIHVGSIEISFGAYALISKLINEYGVLSNFFIKKSIVNKKTFSFSNTRYISSQHEDFYLDKEIVDKLKEVSKKDYVNLLPPKKTINQIREIGIGVTPASIYVDSFNSIITVIPIFNKLTKENIGFLTIRSNGLVIKDSVFFAYVIMFGSIFTLALMVYIFFIISSKGRLFRSMLRYSSEEVFILDLDGNLIDCSLKASKKLGYSMDTMKTLNISHWDKNMSLEDFKKMAETLDEEPKTFNRIFTKRNGFTYDAEISINLFDIDGKKVIYSSVRDISEHNRILEILDYERNKYRNILELSSDGIHIIDAKGRLIEFSETFAQNLGYTSEELEELSVFDWDVGLSYDDILSKTENLIKKPDTFETKHRRKDGSIFDVQITAKGIEIEGETYLYASQRDISVLKNKEKEINNINKKQKSLLSLFEKGDSVLFKWKNDENWSTEYVSSNVKNLLGYSKEEFLSNKIKYATCIHEDDFKKVKSEVESSVNNKKEFFKHSPYKVITKEGKTKWILDYTVTEKNSYGEIEYFIGYLIDISEHENLIANLEKFVDAQENIIILSNGEKISYANKKFFDFFGFNDLKSFHENYNCICERFLENEKFFHIGKIGGSKKWIDQIEKLPDNKKVVSMLSKHFEVHAFFVNVNKFDENLLIVSFTDITQTMIEQIALEEKVVHDKLTGTYNREYFEKNYKLLLQRYEKDGLLALAFLDIDYFKKVNDRYGHDIGDEVLIKFVETIDKYSRESDILIRWGGEEFILILKLKRKKDLFPTLEKLRSLIETVTFPQVGNITCSMGATIHKENENIYTTVKRADKAVYDAKAQGRNKVIIDI